MAKSHDPEFFQAGPNRAQSQAAQEAATGDVALESPPADTKSYDFLKTMKVPKGGLGLAFYNLNKALNRELKAKHADYLVYQQYLRDMELAKAQYEGDCEREYFNYLIRRLKWLDNQGIVAIMAFAIYKSGGKTVSTLLVLATLAKYTERACVAMPATGNHATATLARYSGTAGLNRYTIQQLADDLHNIKNHQDLDTKLAIAGGVRIVAEDKADANKVDNDYKLRNFVEVILGIAPHVRYIGLDLGNDNIHRDSIGLVAVRMAHVINFCYTHKDVILEDTIQDTVRGYNSDRASFESLGDMLRDSGLSEDEMFDINPEDVAKTGFSTPTIDKVGHSVVIANRAGPSDNVVFDRVMRPEQGIHAVPTPTWKGVGVKIPLDPGLDTKQSLIVEEPFSLERCSYETRKAGLEAAIANLEEAARVQGIPIEDAPVYQSPPFPEVAHPFPSMRGNS